MSFEFDARMEDNGPCLRILDADSHALRLVWTYPVPAGLGRNAGQKAVQDLFRELFLLSLLRHKTGEVRLQLPAGASAVPTADRCSR